MDQEKKSLIIKAALKRFTRHGLDKTTLGEIARDLRIGKATLYTYFDSKLDLYYETLNWEKNLYLDELKSILSNENVPIPDRLIEYLKCKENLKEKHKLIYDTILLMLSSDDFEIEVNFLKNIIEEEENIVNDFTEKFRNGASSKLNNSFPKFFVLQSWGLLFENRLYSICCPPDNAETKEMIYEMLGNFFNK